MKERTKELLKSERILDLIDNNNISAVISELQKECSYLELQEVYELFNSCNMYSQEMIEYFIGNNVKVPDDLTKFDSTDKNGKLTLVWRFESFEDGNLSPDIVKFTEDLKTYVEKTFPQYKIFKLTHTTRSFYVSGWESKYYEDVRLILTVPVMKEIADPKLYIKQLVQELGFNKKCLQSSGSEVCLSNGHTTFVNTVKRGDRYCLRIYNDKSMTDQDYLFLEQQIKDFINDNSLGRCYVDTSDPIFRIRAYIEEYSQ